MLLLNSSFAKGSFLKSTTQHLWEKNIIKNSNGKFSNIHLVRNYEVLIFWNVFVLFFPPPNYWNVLCAILRSSGEDIWREVVIRVFRVQVVICMAPHNSARLWKALDWLHNTVILIPVYPFPPHENDGGVGSEESWSLVPSGCIAVGA